LTKQTLFLKNSISHAEGWILDLYPKDQYMIVWLKTQNGRAIRLVDSWQQYFYVAGEYNDLVNLADRLHVEEMSFEEKFIRPEDDEPSTVLRVPARNVHEAERLAERILVYGRCRLYELYNVDVNPSQLYMYEKGIYPFSHVNLAVDCDRVSWQLEDALDSTDYGVPSLREITLSANIHKKGRLPALTDAIESISITLENETFSSDRGDERQKLLWLVEILKTLDPDVVYTSNGDDFLFPYLAYRAKVNGVADQFILGREPSPLHISYGGGQTYVSYGRVYYRPSPVRLLGRIHVDCENSMLYKDCGLPGMIEVARLCRIPMHRVSTTTIGTSMTSAQLYEAVRLGILIPWRKTNIEGLKPARELLIADRGGLYYEPAAGLHESIGELDFTSLYPMIMLTRNLSSETIRCKCCPNSKNLVPELNYNICEKQVGVVPKSLQVLLEKRQLYKKLKQTTTDSHRLNLYEMRQAALKWILVCAFGYLGFKNARFGKIDAHIATCAFARKVLKDTVCLAESKGFKLIHGIVDSIWLRKKGATEKDYLNLKDEIESFTKLPVSFEGVYRWIVFLPSKTHRNIPVLNRYYGVLRNGKIKDRGIATRRRDTPPIIDRCTREVIQVLAEAKSALEFHRRLPLALEIVREYVHILRSGNVPYRELAIRKHLSKDLAEYRHMVLQVIAANQLAMENVTSNAGETVHYVITNSRSNLASKRVLALELCKSSQAYDVEAYVNLLFSAVETMLMPFGFNKRNLLGLTYST